MAASHGHQPCHGSTAIALLLFLLPAAGCINHRPQLAVPCLTLCFVFINATGWGCWTGGRGPCVGPAGPTHGHRLPDVFCCGGDLHLLTAQAGVATSCIITLLLFSPAFDCCWMFPLSLVLLLLMRLLMMSSSAVVVVVAIAANAVADDCSAAVFVVAIAANSITADCFRCRCCCCYCC